MTTKAHLAKTNKIIKLNLKYSYKRTKLKSILKTLGGIKYSIVHNRIQRVPRNSTLIRLKNRCWKTGRARGYIRFFGLCRLAIRDMFKKQDLPSLFKVSW